MVCHSFQPPVCQSRSHLYRIKKGIFRHIRWLMTGNQNAYICLFFHVLFSVCRLLFFFNPFRTLFHQHDLRRHDNQLQIFQNRIVPYVRQIQLQLVIRGCVVFSIYLGITGQSGFDLQAEGKFRYFFFQLCASSGRSGRGPTMDISPFRIL